MADDLEPGVDDDDDSNLAALNRSGSYSPASSFGLSPAQAGRPLGALQPGIPAPSSQNDQRLDRLITGLEESGKRTSKIYEERERALAPMRDIVRETAAQPTEKVPEIKEPPPQPDLRTELSETAQSWMGMATLIAMIGAGRSRTAGTTGLNAMAGIFNGLREGNEDRIKHEFDRWKKASEAIAANNKAMVEAYKLRLENKKYDLDTKIMEMQIVAAEYQDRLMMEALERRNLVDVGKLIGGHERIAQQAENALLRGQELRARLEKLAEQQKNKQQAQQEYTQEAVDNLVRAYIESGPDALKYRFSGRAQDTAALRQAFQQRLTEVMNEEGITYADLRQRWNKNAGERRAQIQVGQRAGTFFLSHDEYEEVVPTVRDAIKLVPRGDYTDINSFKRAIGLRSGSDAEATLGIALNGLVTVYARAMFPGTQIHQAERDEARKLVDASFADHTIEAVLQQMEREQGAARRGISRAIEDVPQAYKKLTPEQQQSLQNAREAIKQRPDKKMEILKRLREGGIDPSLAY